MGDVDYLYEPSGSELHWDGLQKKPNINTGVKEASFSGPSAQTKHPANREGMRGTSAAQAGGYKPSAPAAPQQQAQPRAMSPAELSALADHMLATQGASNAAQLQSGASTGARDAAGNAVPAWLSQHMEGEDVDL